MRLSFQVALLILIGSGAIYAGVNNFYSPSNVFLMFYNIDINVYSHEARLAIESQTRLLSGMWISAGIIVVLSVRKFESNTNVLRLVFLGLSLGSIGELISVVTQNGDVQAAIIKTVFQVGLCLAMELWRIYIVNKVGTNRG